MIATLLVPDPHRRADRRDPVPAPGRHQQLEYHAPFVALEPAGTRPVATRPRSPPSWPRGRSPSWTSRDPGPSPPSPRCSTSCPSPQPPATAGPCAVVLRLRGHLRTNLTFTKALETYAEQIAGSGGSLIVCGLQPATITQLRAAGLPDSITLIAQGEETDGSLADRIRRSRRLDDTVRITASPVRGLSVSLDKAATPCPTMRDRRRKDAPGAAIADPSADLLAAER